MAQAHGIYSRYADIEQDQDIGSSHSNLNPIEPLSPFLENDADNSIKSTARKRWFTALFAPVRRTFAPVRLSLRRTFHGKSWRFGLFAGVYSSLLVLVGNTVVFLVGCFYHGGYIDGIATLAQGDIHDMERISTLYHVLINVCSTILLTSSNYTMQLLCAPTRQEVDDAHMQGRWMDIGLMSFSNLRRIGRRRAVLWGVLGFSSIPLHLLFNSAIFQSNTKQDYRVDLVNGTDTGSDSAGWKVLENSAWSRIYSTGYVAGYGDLRLVVHNASFDVKLSPDWEVSLHKPDPFRPDSRCTWKSWLADTPMAGFQIQLNASTGAVEPADDGSAYRLVVNMSSPYPQDLNKSALVLPHLKWPQFDPINTSLVSTSIKLCPDLTWMAFYPYQIDHGLAQPIPYASKVLMALPFILVVIVANAMKTVAIISALKICSTGHIITIGDAVASFLERPDKSLAGKCTLSKKKLVRAYDQTNVYTKPWRFSEKLIISVIGGEHRSSTIVLSIAVVVTVTFFGIAIGSSPLGNWGTSSRLIIAWTATAPSAGGVLRNAWLANMPQFLLSMVYFAMNRVCTSICCAHEWNNYALHRKGLRVTSAPRGDQKSTHFLHLPYRWAIPLTVTQGFLHWLLSQSLFLVRVDERDKSGVLYDSSVCACGYSTRSLAVFTVVFLLLVFAVLYAILRADLKVYIPPAQHCSAVISAACHPPVGDADAALKRVRWGVVRRREEEETGTQHCSFTSWDVEMPRDGVVYT
ncbi:hypothetical protein K505DRAFT_322270 [Melanomma pulvis-pyrius CBS 109.77]|uniref:DUF6536 domain-containing protein n=1 Tax=Melanomma pulvis-pyrius CBS 109.77 TaxID=1314802 RepID=A0A6A6XMY5_9PLEO|nr:hypothetical protein K505DRAFT_322270 [Melanomma pulvis-pyrius CBS 109.77]